MNEYYWVSLSSLPERRLADAGCENSMPTTDSLDRVVIPHLNAPPADGSPRLFE
jgi:hypothetical protein